METENRLGYPFKVRLQIDHRMLLECSLRGMRIPEADIQFLLELGFRTTEEIMTTHDSILRIRCGLSQDEIKRIRDIFPYESKRSRKMQHENQNLNNAKDSYNRLSPKLRQSFKDWLASQ